MAAMAAFLGPSMPPLTWQPLAGGLKRPRPQSADRCRAQSRAFGIPRAGAAVFLPLVALTRRRAKGKNGKDGPSGVQKWFEEKKAEGTAGVGGAVVGGMLAGPLGAVVGSQVASKLGPVLNDALDALEVDEAEDSPDPKEEKEERASDRKQEDVQSKQAEPEAAKVPPAPKQEEKPAAQELPPKSSETKEPESEPPSPTLAEASPPEGSPALPDELQKLRSSVAEKKLGPGVGPPFPFF